jgi:hypothetical protein
VDVFGFAVHLDQLGLEIETDLFEHNPESLNGVSVKYLSSVLGHEDQVNVK